MDNDRFKGYVEGLNYVVGLLRRNKHKSMDEFMVLLNIHVESRTIELNILCADEVFKVKKDE